MTIANKGTGEQNHLFLFLMKKFKPIKIVFIFSICFYFLQKKNSLFTSDICYLWNGIDFKSDFKTYAICLNTANTISI